MQARSEFEELLASLEEGRGPKSEDEIIIERQIMVLKVFNELVSTATNAQETQGGKFTSLEIIKVCACFFGYIIGQGATKEENIPKIIEKLIYSILTTALESYKSKL